MDKNHCPNSPSGLHNLGGTFATVIHKAEFEPVEYGESAEDTRYRRVEFIISVCSCGHSEKRKVDMPHE